MRDQVSRVMLGLSTVTSMAMVRWILYNTTSMASHLVQWGESCYFCYDRAEKS